MSRYVRPAALIRRVASSAGSRTARACHRLTGDSPAESKFLVLFAINSSYTQRSSDIELPQRREKNSPARPRPEQQPGLLLRSEPGKGTRAGMEIINACVNVGSPRDNSNAGFQKLNADIAGCLVFYVNGKLVSVLTYLE